MAEHRAEPSWLDRQKAGLAEAKAHIDAGTQRQRDVQATRTAPPPVMPAGWYPNPVTPSQLSYWDGAAWGSTDMVRVNTYPSVPVVVVLIAWTTAILSFGYMLPWAVAASRDMPNHGAIGLLNLLLGWTGIGWVVALVMACAQRRV